MAEGKRSFLEPAVLARLLALAAARAPGDARQRLGKASQPGARLLAGVCAVSQVRAGRRYAPARLAHLGTQRPLLHQGIRGRYEPAALPADRYQRLDGLRPGAGRRGSITRGAWPARWAIWPRSRATPWGSGAWRKRRWKSRRSAAQRISGSCWIRLGRTAPARRHHAAGRAARCRGKNPAARARGDASRISLCRRRS